MLEDPDVRTEELDLETIVKGEEEDEEDNDDGEFTGFCVYSKKIAVHGYDGLHVVNLSPRKKSHKSIRIIKERVVAPIQQRLTEPILRLIQLVSAYAGANKN